MKPGKRSYPGQKALRKGRVSLPGHTYILTAVTNRRRPLFADFHIARMVVREMRWLHDQGAVESLAFVV
jgi:hypothetical protein